MFWRTDAMSNIYGYLKSALDGEEKTETKHDIVIFKKCKELALKHGIEYDGKTFVPDDENLADSLFKAGIELLVSVGVYCTTTGRTIVINEDEIMRALSPARPLEIGRSRERVSVPNRSPMDPRPPVIIGGPMGGTVSEENFLMVHLSSAREPIVQGIYAGTMEKMAGDLIQARTPLEMLAALQEARLGRLAIKLAGREGLALMGPSTPTIAPAYLLVSQDDLYSSEDPQEVYQLDELKTDYETFYKLIFHQERGNHYLSGQCPVFGGPSIGSAEGLAIVDVAETIQSKVLTGASFHVSGAVHTSTHSSSTKEILWASNLSALAISRNMKHHKARYYWNSAGCCTDMMFYETAAQAIGDTVSGRDMLIGPVGARGAGKDQSSGLESRFLGEVAYMARDLTLSKANDVVATIYEKYSDRLSDPSPGKRVFSEIADLCS
jgi:methylamine--corrinoid protein Co-methyltransferase